MRQAMLINAYKRDMALIRIRHGTGVSVPWHTRPARLPLEHAHHLPKWLVKSFVKEPYKRDNILQNRPMILRMLLPHSDLTRNLGKW